MPMTMILCSYWMICKMLGIVETYLKNNMKSARLYLQEQLQKKYGIGFVVVDEENLKTMIVFPVCIIPEKTLAITMRNGLRKDSFIKQSIEICIIKFKAEAEKCLRPVSTKAICDD